MLSFEGKRIDFGATKPKLRRFEIRAFCDKMRPACFLRLMLTLMVTLIADAVPNPKVYSTITEFTHETDNF